MERNYTSRLRQSYVWWYLYRSKFLDGCWVHTRIENWNGIANRYGREAQLLSMFANTCRQAMLLGNLRMYSLINACLNHSNSRMCSYTVKMCRNKLPQDLQRIISHLPFALFFLIFTQSTTIMPRWPCYGLWSFRYLLLVATSMYYHLTFNNAETRCLVSQLN